MNGKRIFQFIMAFLVCVILTGCQGTNVSNGDNASLSVSSNSSHPGTFVADPGQMDSATYQITLNDPASLDLSTTTYNFTFSGLSAPFSITQNSCQNVTPGASCSITVQFSPTSAGNNFVQQSLVISADNVSTTLPLTGVGTLLSVPITTYGDNNIRTGISVAVGNGPTTTAMLDTGSSALVVEQSFAGDNLQTTNQKIGIQYVGFVVQGTVAYGSVEIGGNTFLTTSNETPIIVVPDGSLYPRFGAHAVFGAGIDTNVSARNYLPYPFNEMMLIDRAHTSVSFGNFDNTVIQSFANTQLNQQSCVDLGILNTAHPTCWDDTAVPMNYQIEDQNSQPINITINTIFDTGEFRSTLVAATPPSWAVVSGGSLENKIISVTMPGNSSINVPLTSSVDFYQDPNASTIRFNSGPDVFNYYQFLYDQRDGIIGLKPNS